MENFNLDKYKILKAFHEVLSKSYFEYKCDKEERDMCVDEIFEFNNNYRKITSYDDLIKQVVYVCTNHDIRNIPSHYKLMLDE